MAQPAHEMSSGLKLMGAWGAVVKVAEGMGMVGVDSVATVGVAVDLLQSHSERLGMKSTI